MARRHLLAEAGEVCLQDGQGRSQAAAAIEAGRADAIAFGRLFIANPDLPERARRGTDLNTYDRATFYGSGADGDVDYPTLEAPSR